MSLDRILAREPPVLIDGGTGSELRRRGLALSPACWSAAVNLDHGELLKAIHRDYIDAGARIVTANTFGTARFVLAAAGLDTSYAAVIRAAIAAARAAIVESGDRSVLLAASLSCMPPRFDRRAWPPPDIEYRDYAELAGMFAAEGVDLVMLEMLQDAAHATLACRAVAQAGLPFVAGLSVRVSPPTLVTFDDTALPIRPALDAVLAFSPAAVAIMHTPLDAMGPALEWLRSSWSGPIGAWAEIPYPEDPDAARDSRGQPPARMPPADYARAARDWIGAGARLIGGCCGTTPAHIAAIAADGLR